MLIMNYMFDWISKIVKWMRIVFMIIFKACSSTSQILAILRRLRLPCPFKCLYKIWSKGWSHGVTLVLSSSSWKCLFASSWFSKVISQTAQLGSERRLLCSRMQLVMDDPWFCGKKSKMASWTDAINLNAFNAVQIWSPSNLSFIKFINCMQDIEVDEFEWIQGISNSRQWI